MRERAKKTVIGCQFSGTPLLGGVPRSLRPAIHSQWLGTSADARQHSV